ncbi:Trimethyllysine dioxygenase [Zalerion maritima]|uniref:trimethyllysine dioxygenase n=1 Tax=Zalerion maritima TaxID=339359 RepID=A0AAD5RVA4_9PEZI|nr:Trimethyllysine dioxygenase [Zalerion maritima]
MNVFRAFKLRQQSARIDESPKVNVVEQGVDVRLAEELAQSGNPVGQNRTILPSLWLRDSCRCSQCVNKDTSQRNFNTFTLPKDLAVTEALNTDGGLQVRWSDGHQSNYPWNFVKFYLKQNRRVRPFNVGQWSWGAEIGEGKEIDYDAEGVDIRTLKSDNAKHPPAVKYEDVMDESKPGISRLTKYIQKFGFVFVTDTPPTPEATKAVLERIAFIRVTHYGGFYDFIPDLAMADTAYTNLALPAHTDTTYFTEPAGIQSFHMLEHKPAPGTPEEGGLGGKSLLVDGKYAAFLLRKEDPNAYNILSKTRVQWHASGNKGISISPAMQYPVLETFYDGPILARVRWNNDDRGIMPLNTKTGFDTIKWYEAAAKWEAILRRPEVEYWFQLTPGKVLIFDNWRVMHGRSAFTGTRRICGGYLPRDDFVSRWLNTNFSKDEIAESVVG